LSVRASSAGDTDLTVLEPPPVGGGGKPTLRDGDPAGDLLPLPGGGGSNGETPPPPVGLTEDRDGRGLPLASPVDFLVCTMTVFNNNKNNNNNLGRKISSSSGDDREGAFLFQRVSVLVQRFNAVLLHDSLPTPDCTD